MNIKFKMKKILFSVICMGCLFSAFSQQVSSETAQLVAENFYAQFSGQHKNAVSVNLYSTKPVSKERANSTATYYYIYNTSDGGFVIVSGDKRAVPVLAYSTESTFDTVGMPDNIRWWFSTYEDQIDVAVTTLAEVPTQTAVQWNECINNQFTYQKATTAVSALLTTKWDQGSPYNTFCPYDASVGKRTYTGCVATAMAQIMKYWNYPTTGSGSSSYTSPYGTLSANYGSTTYKWGSMANTPSSSDTNVARLMYHCGVAVEMDYGTDGSGAYTYLSDYYIQRGYMDARTAMKNYFKYYSAIGYDRSSFSDAAWIDTLKAELDLSRPILYAGQGTNGGHAFVFDGYNSSNYFHVNWGWSGSSDGYFQISALNPGLLGAGGGAGGFNNSQKAIIHLYPTSPIMRLQMNANLTITPTNMQYGNSFRIIAKPYNSGNLQYKGDFTIKIFDSTDQYICDMEAKTDYTLNPSNLLTLNFYTSGLSELYPGSYYASLYGRHADSTTWFRIDDGDYSNRVNFKVTGVNLQLMDALSMNIDTVIEHQGFTITAKIANTGNVAFNGSYAMMLLDTAGEYVTTVREYSEQTLAKGDSATLLFGTLSRTLQEGTYEAKLYYKKSSDTIWREVNGGDYENSLEVIVKKRDSELQINSGEALQAMIPYPNPTTGKVSFNIGFQDEANVEIVDIFGRVLHRSTISASNPDLDISSYSNGVYLIRLSVDGKSCNYKIVKQSCR